MHVKGALQNASRARNGGNIFAGRRVCRECRRRPTRFGLPRKLRREGRRSGRAEMRAGGGADSVARGAYGIGSRRWRWLGGWLRLPCWWRQWSKPRLLPLPAAQAQETRTLQGTVVDSGGLPINGARVEFDFAIRGHAAGGNGRAGETCDPGRFR